MNKDSTECKALQIFIIESNLTQVVEDHTRRVTNKCASLLDVIMTSSPSLIKSSGVLSTCISDHLPVYAIVRMKVPKPQQSFKSVALRDTIQWNLDWI
jgi:endonuclease/exonuclease/phosphatase family metal-dependent hydrolase